MGGTRVRERGPAKVAFCISVGRYFVFLFWLLMSPFSLLLASWHFFLPCMLCLPVGAASIARPMEYKRYCHLYATVA